MKTGDVIMKSPLLYQLTEESCGYTSVINSISFLFDREEMPLEFLRLVSSYSINCYDDDGKLNNSTFTEQFLFFVSSWLNDFAKEKHIPLKTKYLRKDEVNLLQIRNCLLAGGVVTLKTAFKKNSFFTITNMDEEFIYIFDPVYKPKVTEKTSDNFEVILNKPFYYNRKVRIEYFISESKKELTLGLIPGREAVLFYRDNAILQREMV